MRYLIIMEFHRYIPSDNVFPRPFMPTHVFSQLHIQIHPNHPTNLCRLWAFSFGSQNRAKGQQIQF